MKDRHFCFLMRLAILLITLCGILVCVFGVSIGILEWNFTPQFFTKLNKPELIIQYVFQWIVSLPCFWIMFICWLITNDMREGKLFSKVNVTRISRSLLTLAIDIIVYVIGYATFAVLGWNKLLVLHLFVAVVGLIFVIALSVISHYLYRATQLQEESDLTI